MRAFVGYCFLDGTNEAPRARRGCIENSTATTRSLASSWTVTTDCRHPCTAGREELSDLPGGK
ncbi:hypothetical protein ACFPK5_14340 [Streptomyces beijiangensis]|uniref:hypothetical protein n=1 Tax=Streptomyces beijiangensis TaxID=163361 RepID=UPI003621B666